MSKMVLKFTQNTHVYAVVLYFDFNINQDMYRYKSYCLELWPVSYKCLVSFSGWENTIKTKINAKSRLNATLFVDSL